MRTFSLDRCVVCDERMFLLTRQVFGSGFDRAQRVRVGENLYDGYNSNIMCEYTGMWLNAWCSA